MLAEVVDKGLDVIRDGAFIPAGATALSPMITGIPEVYVHIITGVLVVLLIAAVRGEMAHLHRMKAEHVARVHTGELQSPRRLVRPKSRRSTQVCS